MPATSIQYMNASHKLRSHVQACSLLNTQSKKAHALVNTLGTERVTFPINGLLPSSKKKKHNSALEVH